MNKYSSKDFSIYFCPREEVEEGREKGRTGGRAAKSTICHARRTDHVSTNNSNARLIRSAFLLSGTDEEHGPRVFSALLLSIHLPFVTSNYIRRATDLWDTRRTRRPNGWPRFNADPIVQREEFRGFLPYLVPVEVVGIVPASTFPIYVFLSQLYSPPLRSISEYDKIFHDDQFKSKNPLRLENKLHIFVELVSNENH